jgi:DNA-binding transcriptional LysR family regulator
VRLLNRTKRTVSLTDAGAGLLAEARRVLQQVEAARLAINEVRDRSASRLRLVARRGLSTKTVLWTMRARPGSMTLVRIRPQRETLRGAP